MIKREARREQIKAKEAQAEGAADGLEATNLPSPAVLSSTSVAPSVSKLGDKATAANLPESLSLGNLLSGSPKLAESEGNESDEGQTMTTFADIEMAAMRMEGEEEYDDNEPFEVD